MPDRIAPEKWGRDHWGLLAFCECRAVDNKGELDRDKLRCNETTHAIMEGATQHMYRMTWKPEWGTVLQDGTLLEKHDDWDCLDDLEAAGLLKIESLATCTISMTELGVLVAHAARTHRAQHHQYRDFGPTALAIMAKKQDQALSAACHTVCDKCGQMKVMCSCKGGQK